MAFPTTTGLTQLAAAVSHTRPFVSSGGNVYVFGRVGSTTFGAKKATDPTSSFSTAGSDVTLANNFQGITAVQAGDVIHVVTTDASSSTSVNYRYHVFDMSSDSWTTTNETITTGVDPLVNNAYEAAFQVAMRSDGDILLIYNGPSARNMGTDYRRVYYARRESGSWTVNVSLDNGGAANWEVFGVVMGSSDRAHFFLADGTSQKGYQRSLTSANSLQAFPASFEAGLMVSTNGVTLKRGASYVSGADTKVRMPLNSNTSAVFNSYKFDSADTPSFSSDSDITGSTDANASHYSGSADADGTTLWFTFTDNASNDIYTTSNANDGGWGTPSSFYANASAISCTQTNIYSRGGNTVIGISFRMGSDIYYHEKTIAAGTTNAAFDMDAAATLTMTGRSTASSSLSASTVASAAFNGRSTATTNLDADAAASVTWTGAEVIAATEADWSSTATAAVTWGGVGLYPAVFDSNAAATLVMAGAGNAAAAWSSTTTAALTMAGAATGAATLDSDAAATLTLNGVAVSSAAWEATATASVTWVGVALTLAAAAWESTATAALAWTGEANASANWSAAAVASLAMASESDAATAWSSTATASLVMVGSSDAASVWSATATANLTTAGSSVLSAAWEATAAASVTFNGQALATVNAAWNMAAAATLELAGASDAATDWSATAVASVTFNGEADAASLWAATAAASVTFNGAPVSSATWEADATASVTFVGEDGATTTTESDASFIAATSVTMAGEADAEGVFDCQATASATFTGVAIGAVAAVRHEGAKIKRLQREARQAQEEEDIMLLAAAFIQYLEQNHGNY